MGPKLENLEGNVTCLSFLGQNPKRKSLPQEQRETGYISYPEAHRQETPRMSPQRIRSVDSILVQFLSVWPQEGKEIGLPYRVELGIYKRNCAQFQPCEENLDSSG